MNISQVGVILMCIICSLKVGNLFFDSELIQKILGSTELNGLL